MRPVLLALLLSACTTASATMPDGTVVTARIFGAGRVMAQKDGTVVAAEGAHPDAGLWKVWDVLGSVLRFITPAGLQR